MEIERAFEIITSKVDEVLLGNGYTKQDVAAGDNELTVLYTGEVAYSVVYYKDNMRVVLRNCAMVDGEPDNSWKTVATWLFDPVADNVKEATNIGEDFAETIRGPKQIEVRQKQKKTKKEGEGNNDPLFFANRMVAYFPELRDEIAYEKAHYENFRGVTFAEEKIVPRFRDYVKKANKNTLEKMSKNFATMYDNGDLDVKGIITYLLFNAVDDDEKYKMLVSEFEKSNRNIADEARRLRGKKLKPEKPKKKRKFIADTLNGR